MVHLDHDFRVGDADAAQELFQIGEQGSPVGDHHIRGCQGLGELRTVAELKRMIL